jgi:hypothetical protein
MFTEFRVLSQVSPCRIFDVKLAIEQDFLQVFRFYPVNKIPRMPHIHSPITDAI